MIREELEDPFVVAAALSPNEPVVESPPAIQAMEAEPPPAVQAMEVDSPAPADEDDGFVPDGPAPADEDDEGDAVILVEEMPPLEALAEAEIEHVDLAPPTISEIVLIGARETETETKTDTETDCTETDCTETESEDSDEPPSLASLAALAAVANEMVAAAVAPTSISGSEPEVASATASATTTTTATASATASAQLPPAPDDPFTVLVCRLSDVALSAGAPHVAAMLPELLLDGKLPASIELGTLDALRDGGLVVANEISPTFVSRTNAWREILRGTSDDFEAAGNVMLDEWAADVLARLLSAPQRATSLRQELRTRGVAAFGLVEAA